MSMDIEEQLEVHAPVERVWRFLIDPEQVVFGDLTTVDHDLAIRYHLRAQTSASAGRPNRPEVFNLRSTRALDAALG